MIRRKSSRERRQGNSTSLQINRDAVFRGRGSPDFITPHTARQAKALGPLGRRGIKDGTIKIMVK